MEPWVAGVDLEEIPQATEGRRCFSSRGGRRTPCSCLCGRESLACPPGSKGRKTSKSQDPANVVFQNADRTYLVQPGKLIQRSRDQLLQFLRGLIGQKRKARQQQISLKVDPLDESVPPVGPNPSHSTLVDRREEVAPLQQVRERRRARRAVGRRDRQVRLEEESEVVRQGWSGEKGYEFCLRLKDGRLGWLFDREGRTSCTPIRGGFGALGF